MSWNFADLFEAVARTVPSDHIALIQDDQSLTWGDLDARSNNLARALIERGLQPGDKVAFYLRNQPAYLETLIACFKSRLVHVNVNYRFKAPELNYIFDNSDARAVVYAAEFRPLIAAVRPQLPDVRLWIEVGDDALVPAFADRYEPLAARGDGAALELARSPEDLLFIYTGGTTGMPKGVMWTHDALLTAQFNSLSYLEGSAPPTSIEQILQRVRTTSMHTRQLPAAPLMHATAVVVALGAIMGGGSVVTLHDDGSGFDPHALWRAVARHRVTTLTIVGDSFAKPLLRVLDEHPGRYDLSSLKGIISSGVIWSLPVKQGLLRHLPHVMLLDNFGSTEAPACGTAIMTRDKTVDAPVFRVGEDCKVFSEDGREIQPGSGEAGLIARAGPIPLGYYKDEEKTRKTFRTVNGVRYAIPGDYCTVAADGTLTLLGRGSQCINTGGEKVYAEEVEEALKRHAAIDDALVLGVPDPRWGQAVVAAVVARAGAGITEQALRDAMRASLAGYKIPKRIVFRASLNRLPNGKADYRNLKNDVLGELGIEAS
jgi:3-oxocholest-4-en-26-oate---CoA ligase